MVELDSPVTLSDDIALVEVDWVEPIQIQIVCKCAVALKIILLIGLVVRFESLRCQLNLVSELVVSIPRLLRGWWHLLLWCLGLLSALFSGLYVFVRAGLGHLN